MTGTQVIPPAEALFLLGLVVAPDQGIASRILAKTGGGNLTLFAFDRGQGLSEHTSPFEAFVIVLSGALNLTIGGETVRGVRETIVRMPAGVPHAVEATEVSQMLLVMLREQPPRP
jgi:quercetin dioxygenase-like cupin family protein